MSKIVTTIALAAALALPLTVGSANAAKEQEQAGMTKQFISQQSPDQLRAAQWIGVSVKNDKGEVVGDVNDLLIGTDHSVEALVIGVGGFLGLGEKHVAVPIDSVEMTKSGDDKTRTVMISATKEELENAPTFKMVGNKTLRERMGEAGDAARKTYENAKDSVEKTYDRAKDAVQSSTETDKKTTQ